MTERAKHLLEFIQKPRHIKISEKALYTISRLLLLFAVGSFILTPCIQLLLLVKSDWKEDWYNLDSNIIIYQTLVKRTNTLAFYAAILCYVYYIVHIIKKRRTLGNLVGNYGRRMMPVFLMWLLAAAVWIVTMIRGANRYDIRGHSYMDESIYSYMLYPVCYFFCGCMLWQSKYKRLLLYLLVFSAVPVNIMALVHEWGPSMPFFLGTGVSAVFHNSNHYGYYLMLVIVASLMLFIYEEKLVWRVIDALSAILATIVLIPNNTLGAYLAVLVVLISFIIYCAINDHDHIKRAAAALGMFLAVTFCLSFKYNTILSSVLVMFGDIGLIASDPLGADSAGSSRWRLWKGTVRHMPESPWLGFGIEGLLDLHGVGTPHNELLQYAAFFGIPVMLIYLSAVLLVIITVLKRSKALDKMTLICFCMAVGYFVSSMVGVAIYYTTPFFYIFLGLTYAEWLHGNDKSCEQK